MRKYEAKSIQLDSYINWSEFQLIPTHKISYLEFGDPRNENVIICTPGITRKAQCFNSTFIKMAVPIEKKI